MKTPEPLDPLPPLGQRKPRPEEVAAATPAPPREIKPGIVQDADGKLRTNTPPPAGFDSSLRKALDRCHEWLHGPGEVWRDGDAPRP